LLYFYVNCVIDDKVQVKYTIIRKHKCKQDWWNLVQNYKHTSTMSTSVKLQQSVRMNDMYTELPMINTSKKRQTAYDFAPLRRPRLRISLRIKNSSNFIHLRFISLFNFQFSQPVQLKSFDIAKGTTGA